MDWKMKAGVHMPVAQEDQEFKAGLGYRRLQKQHKLTPFSYVENMHHKAKQSRREAGLSCLSSVWAYSPDTSRKRKWPRSGKSGSGQIPTGLPSDAIRKTEATGLSHHLLPLPGGIKAPFSSSRSWCSMCPQSSMKQGPIKWHPLQHTAFLSSVPWEVGDFYSCLVIVPSQQHNQGQIRETFWISVTPSSNKRISCRGGVCLQTQDMGDWGRRITRSQS